MLNDISLSYEYQNLLKRIDALDSKNHFDDDYYLEMQAIKIDQAYLKAKSEQASIFHPAKPKVLALSVHTTNEELNFLMDSLTDLYSKNAKSADDLETLIYSNINNYDFKAMNIRVKAQVDFLDLYFEIEKSVTRHDIKKYLTEKTGITHYIKEYKNGFIIRLHDMNSRRELMQRLNLLQHYRINIESIHIVEIELAIDFYQFRHKGLATALFKSIRLPDGTDNLRIFKNAIGTFTPIPNSPQTMIDKLESGFNIGINHKNADEYWHIYIKTTDHNKQALPMNQWRIRAEKNIKLHVLSTWDNRFCNLKQILLKGFKGINFTQMINTAPLDFKNAYKNKVQPFGLEQKSRYNKSRHKRNLLDYIEKNTQLNQLVSSTVHNLVRNFTISDF